MDRYLDLLDVDATTRAGYEGYIRDHVRPLLGHLQVGKLDGETLDSFYAILRRCRAHCDGRPFVEHRTTSEHDCDAKCRPHTCRPLASSSASCRVGGRPHHRVDDVFAYTDIPVGLWDRIKDRGIIL